MRAGFGTLDIDGWFGQATYDVTIAFQAANGLEADGVVHTASRRKMTEVLVSKRDG
jgi:peptidoglycan hydrolase-like protein with peptidoglycan-binding domain